MLLSTLLRRGNGSCTVCGKFILENAISIASIKRSVGMSNWLINSVLLDGWTVFYEAPLPPQTICVHGPSDLKELQLIYRPQERFKPVAAFKNSYLNYKFQYGKQNLIGLSWASSCGLRKIHNRRRSKPQAWFIQQPLGRLLCFSLKQRRRKCFLIFVLWGVP